MFKPHLLAIAVVSGLTILSGCNDDNSKKNSASDTITQTPNPTPTTTNPLPPVQNNQLTYIIFDHYSARNGGADGWGRIDMTFTNGNINRKISTVVGTPSYESTLTPDQSTSSIIVGNKLYTTDESTATIDNKSGDFAVPIKLLDGHRVSVTYGSGYNMIVDFTSHDLSGKGKNTPSTGTVQSGLGTDLDHYPQFFKKGTFSFPTGSACYESRTFTNIPAYSFSVSSPTDYKTLQQWLDYQKTDKTFNYKTGINEPTQINNIIYEKVGANNELDAVHFTDQNGSYYGAVVYNNLAYDADYSDGVNPQGLAQPTPPVSACDLYNPTAANALAEYMKQQ